MRLLIITQVLDDTHPVLGFFVEWVKRLANRFEKVTVICLQEGNHALPPNVSVYSLGKEKGGSRSVYVRHFFRLLWKLRREYDAVLVHMNPEYVVLAGWFWKIAGKKVGLWYNHEDGSIALSVARPFLNIIFHTSPFAVTAKYAIHKRMPAGIDTTLFVSGKEVRKPLSIYFQGRVAKAKRVHVLLDALLFLRKKGVAATLTVVGPENRDYGKMLRTKYDALIREGAVQFMGPRPHKDTPALYRTHAVAVNLTARGNYDKTVLEAMSTETPVVVSSDAFRRAVPKEWIVEEENAVALADTLERFFELSEKKQRELGKELRVYVEENESLEVLIQSLSTAYATEVKPDPKDFYNKTMPGKQGEDYEFSRWHKTPLMEGQYQNLKKVMEHVVVPLGKDAQHILEVGPGPGTWTEFLLRSNQQARYTLLDISKEMLTRASSRLQGKGSIEYVESDFLAYEPTEKFDFFFSSRAFEYMPDKQRAAQQVANLLKSDGRGVVVTKTPKPFFDFLAGRKLSTLHGSQIVPGDLAAYFREAGLVVESTGIATATVPGFRSPALNRFAFTLFHRGPSWLPWSWFSESYFIEVRKP